MSATSICTDERTDRSFAFALQKTTRVAPALVSAVLAYEDAELERLGKGLWGAIRRQFDGNEVLVTSEWKFEMLSRPALRELAAAEADAAHVVVVAVRDRGMPMPLGVKEWMACWSPQTVGQRVLVVLLESRLDALDTPALDHDFVASRAKACGMDLIVQPFDVCASKLHPCPYSDVGDWRCIPPIAQSLRPRQSVSPNGREQCGPF